MKPLLAACAGVCLLALGLPGTSFASRFDVVACTLPSRANKSWAPTVTHPAHATVGDSCAGEPGYGLSAADRSEPVSTPPGARAEWVFLAPSGTSIFGARAKRTMQTSADDNWRAFLREASGHRLESCQTGPGVNVCGSEGPGDPPSPTLFSVDGLSTPRLSFGVECLGNGCLNGYLLHGAIYAARDITVTLEDPSPPTITGLSGPLSAGGDVSGTPSLSIAASDRGGGVGRLGITLNGFTVPEAVSEPACDYTRPVPCPLAAGGTVALDTSTLREGYYTLRAYAEDAARDVGSRGVSAPIQIRVLRPNGISPGTPLRDYRPRPRLAYPGAPRRVRAAPRLGRRGLAGVVVRGKRAGPPAGKRVTAARPLLRWRSASATGAYALQVWRVRGRRLRPAFVAFPRTAAYRVPAGRLRPGVRYVWRVWGYRSDFRWAPAPQVVSWFGYRTGRGRGRE